MGYTTSFEGHISIDPPLNPAEVSYLQKFAETRRMRMTEGPYYVNQPGFAGQDHGSNVLDYNNPPPGQPGLWCKWEPTADGEAIEWNGHEKFYYADAWMEYLIEHFLKSGAIVSSGNSTCPTCGHIETLDAQFTGFTFDHVLNGEIDAQGEDPEDRWKLVVEDNQVSVKRAKVVWE